MNRLEGKVIIVAGAGGIGNELAARYAREGAAVILGDLDEDMAAAAAEAIVNAGGRACSLRLDGGDGDSIKALVDLAVSRFGGLDGFHANYACFNDGDDPACDILELPMEVYDEVMNVNARGFVLCTRHALPALLARGGGSMIYTSSGAAYLGETVRLAYAMSKISIHALMRHVAKRFGPLGIRANVIAPGVIMHRHVEEMIPHATLERFRESTALKTRLGRPGDIAAMGALLMADEGSFITGQILSVDGGTLMRA